MPSRPSRAFTLVEMLVVISIIAVLSALLLPAVMIALRTARNAAIALEIKQIETAIEGYRLEKGDYPPNFRNPEVVRRHIAKCYPRINAKYLGDFLTYVFPPDGQTIPTAPSATSAGTVQLDESESLVFWLSMTDTNAQFPFLTFMQPLLIASPMQVNAKRYYDFDETRLVATNTTKPSKAYTAKYCQDTFYVYIDSRSYDRPLNEYYDLGRFGNEPVQPPSGFPPLTFAYARFTPSSVRPYWSATKNPNAPVSSTAWRNIYRPANPTTFQLICAGQDGDFGFDEVLDLDVKVFNSGLNYSDGDKDNITNFSGGQTLGNSIP